MSEATNGLSKLGPNQHKQIFNTITMIVECFCFECVLGSSEKKLQLFGFI